MLFDLRGRGRRRTVKFVYITLAVLMGGGLVLFGIGGGGATQGGLVDAITSQVYSPARLFLARGLTFGEPQTEATESLTPLKVKFEEAVRMVLDGEITQGLSCVLILKAKLFLESN